ncbi:hypothetical protein EC912_102411 [Luteibacter rhizovicinus]|uniref:Lipoprotein n=1 Tax=Luteibacter rhizovicinus TaxID=242606 RepID=A0A4R3YUD7_9GAMM|nr:hypothetical protein [Luteibacter rhizovicinus]TCV96062.1 hypothetical protein EC912_102411 [Luteibacter rhizovicinus]
MFRFSLLLLAAALVLLAGCTSAKRSDGLTATLNRYGSTVRWGDFQTAEQFVDPKYREEHPMTSLEASRYAQLRVTAYDDGSGPTPSGENEATQVVQIGLTNINTQAERMIVDKQIWHYDAEKNRWWLMSGLPNVNPQ